jgi:superfamily II DNA/RNA helicase
VKILERREFTGLLPIQAKTFELIYDRRDVIARDLTGSGKTLGFSLPIVEFMRKNQLFGKGQPQAVMLAPTRELAIQVSPLRVQTPDHRRAREIEALLFRVLSPHRLRWCAN